MDCKYDEIEYADHDDDEEGNLYQYMWKNLTPITKLNEQDTFSVGFQDNLMIRLKNSEINEFDKNKSWKLPNNHDSSDSCLLISNRFLFHCDSDEYNSDSLSPRAPIAEEIILPEDDFSDQSLDINKDTQENHDAFSFPPQNLGLQMDQSSADVTCVDQTNNCTYLASVNSICKSISEPQSTNIFPHSSFFSLNPELFIQKNFMRSKNIFLNDVAKLLNLIMTSDFTSEFFFDKFSKVPHFSHMSSSSNMQFSSDTFLNDPRIDNFISRQLNQKDKQIRAVSRNKNEDYIRFIIRYAVENKLKSHEVYGLLIHIIGKTLNIRVVSHVEHSIEQKEMEWTSNSSFITSGCMAVSNDAHIPLRRELLLVAPASKKELISRLGSLAQSSCNLPCEKYIFPSFFVFDHIKCSLFQFNNYEIYKNIAQYKIRVVKNKNGFPEKDENSQKIIDPSSSPVLNNNNGARSIDKETQVTNLGTDDNNTVLCVNCAGSVTLNQINYKLNVSNSYRTEKSTPLLSCPDSLEIQGGHEINEIANQYVIDNHDTENEDVHYITQNLVETSDKRNKIKNGVDDFNKDVCSLNEKLNLLFNLKIINENNQNIIVHLGQDILKINLEKKIIQSSLPDQPKSNTEQKKMKQKKKMSEEAESASTSTEMYNNCAATPTVKPILKSVLKRQQSTGSTKKSKKKNHVQFNEALNKFFDADYVILIREDDEYDSEMMGCDCEGDYYFDDGYEEYEDYNNASKGSSHSSSSQKQKQKYDLCAAFEPPMEFVDQVTLSPPDGYKDCSPHHCLDQTENLQCRGKNTYKVCRGCFHWFNGSNRGCVWMCVYKISQEL